MVSTIGEILTRYYQAPRRQAQLRRDRDTLEKRVSLLTIQAGDAYRAPLEETTIPGTIARYGALGGSSNAISNPTLAMIMRLEECETKTMVQLREARVELYETEQEVEDLTALIEDVDDALSHLDVGDRALLEMHYRDGKTFQQIAWQDNDYADESGPRKRVQRIETDLTRALRPDSVATLRKRLSENVPKTFRKITDNRLVLGLS